mgnify:FL=1
MIKLGDRVYAKTSVMRCAILGTVQQSNDDRVLVVFDLTIRGKRQEWVQRSACQLLNPPTNIEVKNRKMKNHTDKILDSIGSKK